MVGIPLGTLYLYYWIYKYTAGSINTQVRGYFDESDYWLLDVGEHRQTLERAVRGERARE